jgi:hypothetical protein
MVSPLSRTDTTRLIEDEMERSGQITRDEKNAMHWHAGAETMEHALVRMKHDQHDLVDHAAKDVAKETAKGLVKSAVVNGGKSASEALRELPKEVAKDAFEVDGVAVGQAVECGKMYYHAIQDAYDLHNRASEQAAEVVALSVLDLNPTFKSAALAHNENIDASRTVATLKDNYGRLTPHGAEVVGKLQAVADAGAREAINAMAYGRESYLKAHPDVDQRIKVDIAFSIGFENAMSLAHDAKALGALKQTIDARNPWTIADLQVRG